MRLDNFIFSDTVSYRLSRHVVFWTLYSLYFWVQGVNPMNYNEFFEFLPYKYAFNNFCCFMPVCILSVYLFIYVLLPVFLKKRYYLLFTLAFIAWFAVAIFANYFAAGIFLNTIHYSNYIAPDFVHKSNFSYANTVWAITIALFALGIKLSKNWYLQQKENLDMIQRKARTELRLEKSFIQPDFLFRSLDSILSKIDRLPEEPPAMILKLSDLLSYSLYQDELEMVPLEKELACLKDFIFLERSNSHRTVDIKVEVIGTIADRYMPPMIVLSLMQEGVTLLSHENPKLCQVNCQFNLLNNHLHLRTTFSHSQETTANNNWASIIENTTTRLNIFFDPTRFQISISEENTKTIIILDMPLLTRPYCHDVDRDIRKNNALHESA